MSSLGEFRDGAERRAQTFCQETGSVYVVYHTENEVNSYTMQIPGVRFKSAYDIKDISKFLGTIPSNRFVLFAPQALTAVKDATHSIITQRQTELGELTQEANLLEKRVLAANALREDFKNQLLVAKKDLSFHKKIHQNTLICAVVAILVIFGVAAFVDKEVPTYIGVYLSQIALSIVTVFSALGLKYAHKAEKESQLGV